MTYIDLATIISSPFCVSTEDGKMVHDRISQEISLKHNVELSFKGVARLTTAFLNAAIGQLYDEYSDEYIKQHLFYKDTNTSHALKIERTINNAKIFFKDREKGNILQKDASGEE